jgi:two-component system, NarL family, response regulator YdfI
MSSPDPTGEAGVWPGETQAAADTTWIALFKPIEREVLRLLGQALDAQAIAKRLGIADHTVEWHIRHVIEKLQVDSKGQAVAEAINKGLIEV